MPFERARDDVVAAVVLTVSVEVPEPPATELGLNEHVGGGVTTGVMLLHDRFTLLLNPFRGAIVIVEVADAPGRIVAGDAVDAAIVKSAAACGNLKEAVCITQLLLAERGAVA
jgi:hypothetical protein